MTYLDYLPHTPYAELPATAQAEISAIEYAQLQVLGTGLAEPVGLPNALGLALAAKVPTGPGPTAPAFAKTSGVHAGWRLVAVLSAVGFCASILYAAFAKTPDARPTEAPIPQTVERVIIQRDTVEQVVRDTVTLYRTKVEVRVVRDTVYLKRSYPVAETSTPKVDEAPRTSKSLSEGLDWHELTVQGVGLERE